MTEEQIDPANLPDPPYVDDSPDEPPEADIPQSPEPTPKDDSVDSLDQPLDNDGVPIAPPKE